MNIELVKKNQGTVVCKDCWRRMSGYLPYCGITCDWCYELKEVMK